MYKRGKGKITTDFGLREIYEFYDETYPNTVGKNLFRKICKEFNENVLKEVIYEGHDFSMGSRLGSIRIRKFNNKVKLGEDGEIANKFKVNWNKTLKKWGELYPDKTAEEIKEIKDKPLIFHLNEHTDGWVMKWFWDKITCNVPNQSAYRFEPQRSIKREAAKAWKTIPGLKNSYYE